jgi:hypothetical protein
LVNRSLTGGDGGHLSRSWRQFCPLRHIRNPPCTDSGPPPTQATPTCHPVSIFPHRIVRFLYISQRLPITISFCLISPIEDAALKESRSAQDKRFRARQKWMLHLQDPSQGHPYLVFVCIVAHPSLQKCDEAPNASGDCRTCVRLHLECLGFGPKRPDWLRVRLLLPAFSH